KAVRFSVGDRTWSCDLTSYECSKTGTAAPAPAPSKSDENGEADPQRRPGRGPRPREDSDHSPDGKWTVFIKDNNVFVRSSDGSAKEIQLSHDGSEDLAY